MSTKRDRAAGAVIAAEAQHDNTFLSPDLLPRAYAVVDAVTAVLDVALEIRVAALVAVLRDIADSVCVWAVTNVANCADSGRDDDLCPVCTARKALADGGAA